MHFVLQNFFLLFVINIQVQTVNFFTAFSLNSIYRKTLLQKGNEMYISNLGNLSPFRGIQ